MLSPLLAGTIAAEDILSSVFRIHVRKALDPLHLHDFERIVKILASDLKGHAIPVEDAAVKKALAKVDAKWTDLSAPARAKVIGEAAHYLGPPVAAQAMPGIAQTLKFAGTDLFAGAKKSAVHTYDLKVSPDLDKADTDRLGHLILSQAHFVRNQYGDRKFGFSVQAKEIVEEGLARGEGSAAIAERLRSEITALGRSGSYWDMIAMVFSNRARTMAQLGAYHEAGVAFYVWESVLDQATSVQCRFMHGRKFPVAHTMKRFQEVENAESPEAVKTLQPFLQYGKNADGEPSLYAKRADGSRLFVAQVTENAVGQKDKIGAFAHAHSDEALGELGIAAPPIHGRCRSTILPEAGPSTPGPGVTVPAEPPPTPPKLTSGEKRAHAIEALHGVSVAGDVDTNGFFPRAVADEDPFDKLQHHPFFENSDAPGWGAGFGLNATSKKPVIDHLIPTAPTFDADLTEKYIKSPKALDTAPKPKVVQYQGKLYILDGHAQLAAQKLMGQKLAYCDVLNLDGPLKLPSAVTPVEPPPPPPPAPVVVPVVPPPAPPPPHPVTPAIAAPAPSPPAAVVLGEKTGSAAGSNDGGFYTGTDGVKRYVKFYGDPSQAHGEALANAIYNDLGHGAPVASTFEHEGKTAYASNLIDGVRTLESAGLTETRAKAAMKGFVADVLVGNWDAVGMSLDNMVVDPAGRVFRIDNGGSFLMRAKAGRKPTDLLNKISEWDSFFSPTVNPAYAKVAHAAGIASAADMKDLVLEEIAKVRALADAHGGWAGYVETIAGGMPKADKARVVEMLEARTHLLEGKASELRLPHPVDPSQRIVGHLPPKELPPSTAPIPEGHATDAAWQKVVADRVAGARKEGAHKFSGSAYTKIREYEKDPEKFAANEPDYILKKNKAWAEDIEAFFKQATPSPGTTVYRGIADISDADMRAFLANETVRMGATTSTSWTPSVAYTFGNIKSSYGGNRVLFVLKQRSAVAIETFSQHESEDELLLRKGAEFRVTGRYRAQGYKDVLILEGEEIESVATAQPAKAPRRRRKPAGSDTP